MPQKINLMIADDHKMFRESLGASLEELCGQIRITGLAGDGLELLELIKQQPPDIVLLDMNMPRMDGKQTLEALRENHPGIKPIIISNDYTDYLVCLSVLRGAAAYMQKNGDVNELINVIENVWQQGYYFNASVSREILSQLNSDKKLYYLLENKRFSERELEVLKQICKDLTPAQIADNLNISTNTVRYHKTNLMRKTESETVISLVKYAIRQGIINASH